jgi:ribosomal protein S25
VGRASSRKRERRRVSQPADEVPADGVEQELRPGLFGKMQGTGFVLANRMTDEQRRKNAEDLRAELAEGETDLVATRKKLEAALNRLPTEQLLVRMFDRVSRNQDDQMVSPTEIQWLKLEWVIWLALRRNAPIAGIARIDESEFDELDEMVDGAIRHVNRMIIFKDVGASKEKPGPEDEARVRAQLNELNMRGPSYQLHIYRLLNVIFNASGADLKRLFGFDENELGAALRVLDEIRVESQVELFEYIRPVIKWHTDDIVAGKIDHAVAQGFSREVAESVKGAGRDVVRRAVDKELRGRVFSHADKLMVTTPDELAERAKIGGAAARAVLEMLALTFGQAAIGDDRPQRFEPLRLRPLIKLDADRFSLLRVHELPWSVRANLEGALNADAGAFDRYEKHRAAYLEGRTMELFAKMLPGAQIERTLYYTFDDGDGTRTYELDGLILYGDTLFLLEQKAGGFPKIAREGGEPLKKRLEGLIGAAHSQALRTERFVRGAEVVQFRRKDGKTFDLRNANVAEVFLVATTLEELQAFPAQLRVLSELGVLPAGELPWAVPLMDLEAIAELVEWPAQLIHYLRRRIPLNVAPVSVVDELDLFGNYLQDGLDPEAVFGDEAMVQLANYTALFDSYFHSEYLHQFFGLPRQVASLYRMPMKDSVRREIDRLVQQGGPSATAAVCKLLDEVTDKRARAMKSRMGLRRST